ncbi:hypothetical protein ACFVZH_38275 [Streptomyces sp. NPDC059534]|uniref:hypothetical protein n=1 Tax=Streptomyces sp. NPDC059534 TaxID=3346859 RepID=UPI0036D0DAE4
MSVEAIRFRLNYEGQDVWLVSEQRVEMTLPPSDELGEGEHSGFWYETRDGDDQVLYRRVIGTPIRYDYEVSDPDTGQFTRVPAGSVAGDFALLTPGDLNARFLVLYSSPLDTESDAEAATELARFDLWSE